MRRFFKIHADEKIKALNIWCKDESLTVRVIFCIICDKIKIYFKNFLIFIIIPIIFTIMLLFSEYNRYKMKQKLYLPLSSANALRKLGTDIRDARLRRRITMALMAERAGITADTLKQIEKGNPATSIGGYASVLYSLGMTARLQDIADARHDLIGQRLEEERLPKRVRMPKKK